MTWDDLDLGMTLTWGMMTWGDPTAELSLRDATAAPPQDVVTAWIRWEQRQS